MAVGIEQVELLVVLFEFGLDQFHKWPLIAIPEAANHLVDELPDGHGLLSRPVLRDFQCIDIGGDEVGVGFVHVVIYWRSVGRGLMEPLLAWLRAALASTLWTQAPAVARTAVVVGQKR